MKDYESWKSIIDISSAALSPIVAISLALITYNQFQLQKNEHRLALYDRRFMVFQEVMLYLSIIMSEGSIDLERLMNLLRKTNQASFLFDDHINEYIQELYNKGLGLIETERYLHGSNSLPIGEERNMWAEKNSEYLKYFGNQFDRSRKVFSKYLKFRD
jgi:hypothetical protein